MREKSRNVFSDIRLDASSSYVLRIPRKTGSATPLLETVCKKRTKANSSSAITSTTLARRVRAVLHPTSNRNGPLPTSTNLCNRSEETRGGPGRFPQDRYRYSMVCKERHCPCLGKRPNRREHCYIRRKKRVILSSLISARKRLRKRKRPTELTK